MLYVVLLSLTGPELVTKVKEAEKNLKDYTAQMESKTYKDGKMEYKLYLHKYMRPGYIYMKVIKGPNRGGVAVYHPDKKKVRVKKGPLKLWLSPDDRRLRSPVGHRIYESHIPWFVSRLNSEAKFVSEGTLFGRKVLILEQPLDPTKNYGAVRARYWIDASTYLPLMVTDYDSGGGIVRTVKYKNLKINVGLTQEDFKI
ncbi:MAG: DUF1571 domain-containing protein [Thermotogae bacterium]|nr:DUF1571 domain-containing protein [Thermotogota bacterium]